LKSAAGSVDNKMVNFMPVIAPKTIEARKKYLLNCVAECRKVVAEHCPGPEGFSIRGIKNGLPKEKIETVLIHHIGAEMDDLTSFLFDVDPFSKAARKKINTFRDLLSNCLSEFPDSKHAPVCRVTGEIMGSLLNFTAQKGTSPSADNIYSLFAQKSSSTTHTKLPGGEANQNDAISLAVQLLFAADPVWAKTAFSVVPISNIMLLDPNVENLKQGLSFAANPPARALDIVSWRPRFEGEPYKADKKIVEAGKEKGYSPKDTEEFNVGEWKRSTLKTTQALLEIMEAQQKNSEYQRKTEEILAGSLGPEVKTWKLLRGTPLTPLEMSIRIAEGIEHILFVNLLGGFFCFPIFTSTCEPFAVDMTKDTQGDEDLEKILRNIRLKNKKGEEEKWLISPFSYFSLIRRSLRASEMIVRVGEFCSGKIKEAQGSPVDHRAELAGLLTWSEALDRSKPYLETLEKLIPVAERFEPTDIGREYVASEIAALNRVKEAISKSLASWNLWCLHFDTTPAKP